jgi:GNAT superfamily N-acetyltransferase
MAVSIRPISIREATLEDYPGAVALLHVVDPFRLRTVEGYRHGHVVEPPEARRRSWAADANSELVGWVTGALSYESSSGSGGFGLSVHPAWRSRSVGSELLERMVAHLLESGATRLTADGPDEASSRRFAERHGFRRTQTIRISGVDPRAVEPPAPPVGIELRSAEEIGPERVFALEQEAALDVPGEETTDALELEQWLEQYWRHPQLDRDASTVVLVDGRAASFSLMRVYPGQRRGVSDLAGTLRAFRGRGLATLAKRRALAVAAVRGVELALTDNDETNGPMLRVNERLGYRPVGGRISWSRP